MPRHQETFLLCYLTNKIILCYKFYQYSLPQQLWGCCSQRTRLQLLMNYKDQKFFVTSWIFRKNTGCDLKQHSEDQKCNTSLQKKNSHGELWWQTLEKPQLVLGYVHISFHLFLKGNVWYFTYYRWFYVQNIYRHFSFRTLQPYKLSIYLDF